MTFSAEDVKMVLSTISGYLIVMAVFLVVAIAVAVAVRKMDKPKKCLIRWQALFAWLLAVVVCVNTICFGVYGDTLNAALAEKKDISEEAKEASRNTVQETAEEGIILAKNEDKVLPVKDIKKLNVFGWASTNPIYGGSGSGASDSSTSVSLLQGLENAGFELNTELTDFYKNYADARPEAGTSVQDYTLPEPTADTYSEEMLVNAKEFSDYAVVVVARVSGECFDLPTDMYEVIHNDSFDPDNQSIAENGTYTNNGDYDDFEKGQSYLTLDKTEQDMVALVCKNFDNVIVVYNGANTMEMNWTDKYPQIKGVLLCPGAGSTGFNALGEIISGKVNPSGKTVDTWVKDLTQTPYFNNIGDFTYDNIQDYAAEIIAADNGSLQPGTFVDYNENIYVGYKFYETAAEEGLIDYDALVQYPFGYGLSYTQFSQKMGEIQEDENGNITFDVTVTNEGDTAGKDVVEVYYNPPYTNGGIEKASANLIQFEKTNLLQPGESQTITVSFSRDDMASFDSYENQCYVIEKGDYKISLRADSHNVLDEKTYKVSDTVIYDESNPRGSDDTAAVTRFADVEGDDSCDITYLSRKDSFANYKEATAAPSEKQHTMSDELLATYVSNANYDGTVYNNDSDEMPVTGAKNNVKLADLRGLDYEDPKWDDLLDELTYDEMENMIEFGGWHTAAIKSIDKIATAECDGPAGVNNFMTQHYGTSYCVEVMLAQTWSKEIAEKFGEAMGQEYADIDNYGWYGPAMDTHRSAFGGRNFEYYSEDGVLGGYIGAAEINGAATKGVYAYLKHFALNDQEINTREMLCTWTTEQAMREIYLKPFELAIKNFEGTSIGVMVAFNFVGTTWVGASKPLMTEVLRDEWGFRGAAITDYFGGYGYQNADAGVRAGTDLMLNMVSQFAHITDKSATMTKALRQASKNILYTVVNSGAYTEQAYQNATKMPAWRKTFITVDVILGALLVAAEIAVVMNYRKKKREQGNKEK